MAFYTEDVWTGKLYICVYLSSYKQETNFAISSRMWFDEYLTSVEFSILLVFFLLKLQELKR